MAEGFYSLAAARRSLVYFVFGKAGAAISGLAFLLIVLRVAPVEAYGAYVALMAATEIFYIASGLGLSYFAQRYVPELRVRATATQFNRQLWRWMTARAVLAVAFALPVWVATSYWGSFLSVQLSPRTAAVFVASLVIGSVMRYIDELLQALLLQGWAQLQSVVRNLVRLTTLALAALLLIGVDLHLLLLMELCVAALAVITGVMTFAYYMSRTRGANSDRGAHHRIEGAWRQGLRLYLAQMLGQAYGSNAMKLLVTSIVGVHGTAVLGFGQSLADLLRNYSPAFLLGGWVRPIMVARYVESRSADALKPLTQLVVSLSIVGLLPFVMVFAVFGHEVATLVAGGKYPDAAPLLAPLVGVVCLQAVHAVFSMVCATIERTVFILAGTVVSIATLPMAYFLTQWFGLGGTVAALFIGELLWVMTVYVLLLALFGRADFFDSRGLLRAGALAIVLGLLVALIHSYWPLGGLGWLAMASVVAVLYWVLAWRGRVFGPEQRALIGKLLRRTAA